MKRWLYSACFLACWSLSQEMEAQKVLVSDSLKTRSYENAFDYLLQKPLKTEKFEHKRTGDHLFTMGALGANWLRMNGTNPMPVAQWMIGDWITPVHGIRLGVKGGWMDYAHDKNKFVGAELDYLMNLSAIGYGYNPDRKWELSLVAGLEGLFAKKLGQKDWAAGVHAGLMGQVNLSKYMFAFAEPRLALYTNGVAPAADKSWRNYRLGMQLFMGMGYRLMTGDRRDRDEYSEEGWDDNLFIVAGLGVGALVPGALKQTFDHMGPTASLALGKELNPYSAWRAKLKAGMYATKMERKLKVVNAQVDYMLNLTNLMAGYRSDRKYWLNAVAGVNLAASKYEFTEVLPGLGAGMQMNFAAGRMASFYLEPRLDVYGEKFYGGGNSFRKTDWVLSMEAGVNLYRRKHTNRIVNKYQWENKSFWDNWMVQGAIGASMPATRQVTVTPGDYMEPIAYAALGKWWNELSGTRLALEVRKYRSYPQADRINMAMAGVDYLFNISNFIAGFDPDRRFEALAAAGLRLGMKSKNNTLYPGVNVAVQGVYHLNGMTGLFVEPALQAYSSDFVNAGMHVAGMGFLGSVMVGVNLRMRGYDMKVNKNLYDKDETVGKRFVTLAGGAQARIKNLREFFWNGKAGYGYRYCPYAAWRVNLENAADRNYTRWTLGGDWMPDLSTLAYGYDAERKLTLKGVAGVALGVETNGNRNTFSPDIHVGGQMELRLSPQVGLFAEPMLTGKIITGKTAGKRIVPAGSAMLGLNYYFK